MQIIFSSAIIKTFDECPQKFKLKYEENLAIPTENTNFKTGKKIHALANYYLSGVNIKKFESHLSQNELELWNYLKKCPFFNMNTIASEYELMFKLDTYWLKGRLDALVKDNNDNYFILDYKTGSIKEDKTYDYQTMIYLLAIEKIYSKNTNNFNFVYLNLKDQKEISIKLTPELKNEYELILKKKCSEISKIINSPITTNCPKEKYEKCEYNIICNKAKTD